MADQQTRFLEGFADGCSQQSAGTGIAGPAAHPDLELLHCSGVALMGYHPARIVGFRAPTWEDILARHENMGLMALPHQYAGDWSIKPDDNEGCGVTGPGRGFLRRCCVQGQTRASLGPIAGPLRPPLRWA